MSHDEISNPKHYDLFPDGMQAIDVIRAALTPEEFAGYCKGNFLKYRLRAGEKGDPVKCLGKAEWYRAELREHHAEMRRADIDRLAMAVLGPNAKRGASSDVGSAGIPVDLEPAVVANVAAFNGDWPNEQRRQDSEAEDAARNVDSAAATSYGDPTLLPDGSAFAVMSFPLPADHWLYAPRQYADGAVEPRELPRPILNHDDHREAVTAAVRYAIRGATNCGAEPDFDPDALVQNAVYALCGPFSKWPDEGRRQDAEAEDEAFAAINPYTGPGGVMIQCPGCTAQSCECRP